MQNNNNSTYSNGTLCHFCKYRRRPTDTAPDWECPNCQRVYHKVPRDHQHRDKMRYAHAPLEPTSFFERIPKRPLTALTIVLLDIGYGLMTDWQYLRPELDALLHTVIVIACFLTITFIEPALRIYHQYMPLRTGLIERLAKKNPKEEALIIRYGPKLYELVAWAGLIWFVFIFSWR